MQDMSVSPEMADKKNYVSIKNQKLIISQYADDHGVKIDAAGMKTTEFPVISSTVRDFRQMMADLDKDD